jgi:hypothetical protein
VDIQKLIDQFTAGAKQTQPDVQALLDPMFSTQRTQLQQQLEAQGALTPGRTQSGGFGQNMALAESNLVGQQSATLAGALQQQSLAQMQQNTALIQIGTTAGMQKYTTDINADLQKFSVVTNADLQKYLDNADNVIKKYGIDTTDLYSRYAAQLQLQGAEAGAGATVNAAGLYAAASGAAAAASAAASEHNAQLQYNLGIAGLGATQQNNQANFILGLLGLGGSNIGNLDQIINSIIGGNTYVKP